MQNTQLLDKFNVKEIELSDLHRQNKLEKWTFDQEVKKMSKLLSEERNKLQELVNDHVREIANLKADNKRTI